MHACKVYVVLYAILTNRRPVMDPAGKYPRYFGYPAVGRKPPTTLEGAKVLNQGECERDPVKCLRFENQVRLVWMIAIQEFRPDGRVQ